MALPDRLVDRGLQLQRYGVAFALFPAGGKWATEIQRAPDDGGGSPDVGSAVVAGYLNPGQQKFVDDSIGSAVTIYHYRARHVREGYTASGYTGWIACKSELIPDVLPLIPSEATKASDLSIDPDTGDITIEVNGSRKVGSVIWDVDVGVLDDWPNDPDASTTYTNDTDSEGDVSIDVSTETSGEPGGSRTAPVGQQIRATIWFYAAASAGGAFLGSLRISALRGQSGSSPLPSNGVAFVVVWEQDSASGFGKYKATLQITVGTDIDSINFTAVDAPLDVNVDTNQNLTGGELTDLYLEVKISGFDTDTSDGCKFVVTGYDAVGGDGGSGDPGAPATVGVFVPLAGSDVNTSGVDDLVNVTFNSPAVNELMAFTSATAVENKTAAELGLSTVAAFDDLSDVTITSVADDHAIMYDSGSGLWVNRFLSSADLSDEAALARLADDELITGEWGHDPFDNGDKNSAWTMDGNNGNIQRVNLTGSCTATLSVEEGKPVLLYISYSGAFTLTISGADYGTAGTPPWTSATLKMDRVYIEKLSNITTVTDAGMGFTKAAA